MLEIDPVSSIKNSFCNDWPTESVDVLTLLHCHNASTYFLLHCRLSLTLKMGLDQGRIRIFDLTVVFCSSRCKNSIYPAVLFRQYFEWIYTFNNIRIVLILYVYIYIVYIKINLLMPSALNKFCCSMTPNLICLLKIDFSARSLRFENPQITHFDGQRMQEFVFHLVE